MLMLSNRYESTKFDRRTWFNKCLQGLSPELKGFVFHPSWNLWFLLFDRYSAVFLGNEDFTSICASISGIHVYKHLKFYNKKRDFYSDVYTIGANWIVNNFNTRNVPMVHVVTSIRFQNGVSKYAEVSLCINYLVSATACVPQESPRAIVAKFYGRVRLILYVLKASQFSCFQSMLGFYIILFI